jgi:phage major head subunit gpT-like protein
MINAGNWQEANEPIAIKNFALGFKEKPMERDMLFTVRKTTKLFETYLELGDIGAMGKKNGDIEFEDVSQGWTMQIEQEEYVKGMKIEKKFQLTDQLHIVEDLPRLLGLAARRMMSSHVFRMFNEGFSTAYSTIDGVALFSSSHVNHENQGGDTWSNYGTGAFTEPEVEAVRVLMKKRLSNSNALIELNPDLLIVPRELEAAAYELIKSSGKVDTANNNANFHKGRYKVLVSDYLDDADNWFFVDSELAKMNNAWNNVAPLEFGQTENWDGMDAKYRAYCFYGYGTREARPFHGSEVN